MRYFTQFQTLFETLKMPLISEDATRAIAFVEDGRSRRYFVQVLHTTPWEIYKALERYRKLITYSRRRSSDTRVTTTKHDHLLLQILLDRHTSVQALKMFVV